MIVEWFNRYMGNGPITVYEETALDTEVVYLAAPEKAEAVARS